MRQLTLAAAVMACGITTATAQTPFRSETYEFRNGQLERQYPTPGSPNQNWEHRERTYDRYRRDYGDRFEERGWDRRYGQRWRDRDYDYGWRYGEWRNWDDEY